MPSILKRVLQELKENRAAERAAKPRPKLVTNPHCKGCGTYVEKGQEFCATCVAKRGAPQPSIVLTPVKEPAYARKPTAEE
ncbi:MAG TPA: hypothetical protein VL333_13070 [Candidatus Saccharimonadales bacterium]|jgi:hypothetical protein|nr:hypothetical protein [Candidatus Saccharimonadales bacterium]